MKRILVLAALVAACCLVFTQPKLSGAYQKGNDEQAVRKFLDELFAALSRNDTAALDRFWADSYTLVNESGELTTKGPRLAALKSGELKYESASCEEANIRFYGGTAVAICRVMVKGQNKGQPMAGAFRVTLTLVKDKGRWQVAAAQASTIAKEKNP